MSDAFDQLREAVEASLEAEAIVVRRPWLFAATKWAAIGLCTIVCAPVILGCPFVWAFGVSGLLHAARSIEAAWRRRGRPGVLAVDGDTLWVSHRGKTIGIPRARITQGWIEERVTHTELRLALVDGREIRAVCADEPAAQKLLSTLGLSARQRVAIAPLGSAAASRGMGVVYHFLGPWLFGAMGLAGVANLSVAGNAMGLAMLLGSIVVSYLFARDVSPGSIVIGADGITVRTPWRRRFIPLVDIADIDGNGDWVRLALASKETRLLPARRLGEADGKAARDLIVARVTQAREAAAASAAGVDLEALDRAGRDVATWRRDLAALVAAPSDYRRLAVEIGAFERALGDTTSPPERRIGAAIALASATTERDPALDARLRVATAAVANEPLRAALDKALAGELEEAELEAALAEATPQRRAR